MKEVKDLTPADLMNQGRRWVIVPGDFIEGKGFRVEVIFEEHPFRFPDWADHQYAARSASEDALLPC